MLLSLNWLRDYLQKPDIKFSPEELAQKLTMRGLAVESIKKYSPTTENIVVGRINKIDPHPEAERIQITKVSISDVEDRQALTIVCGATNIVEGDLVAVALPGSVLSEGHLINKATIREVESEGMLCSGKELGISEDTNGVLQLPKHAKIGESVFSLFGSIEEDYLLEFELTPNRGDCLSVLGLAREIAPILKTKVREPKETRFRVSQHRTSSIIKIEVEDPQLCPRYVARVIDGLKVTESPNWIKQRLIAVGIRPINNIVDITNFVMIEYGQPLHAFDLRKIKSSTLRVAACKEALDFTTLAGETLRLEENDILIQDGNSPVALAGIMGGVSTQIENDTTSIILESAAFSATHIRRTAKRLNLHTDSSKRFEKGTDITAVAMASERAAALLRDSYNGNVYHPPIDTNADIPKEKNVAVDMRDIRNIIGIPQLTAEQAGDLLESIGISSNKRSPNILSVQLPHFRRDLFESIDIIEEVARLHGYDAIPLNYPSSAASYKPLPEKENEFEAKVKGLLCNLGLRETIQYSFTSEETLKKYGYFRDDSPALKNPISDELKILRPSLLPSLLETYRYNHNRKAPVQKIFEFANCYFRDERSETGVRETPFIAGLLAGHVENPGWNVKPNPVNFYHAKGIVEALVRQLTTVFIAYEPLKDSPLFHPAKSASLRLGLKIIGSVGEIHPYLRQRVLESQDSIVLFEIDLDALKKYERDSIRYKSPSKFPSFEFDIAVTVDKLISGQSVMDLIKQCGGNLLFNVSIFDVYEGSNIPEDKKSLAFHLTFLSSERTLMENEVIQLREKIIQNLSDRFNAKLR